MNLKSIQDVVLEEVKGVEHCTWLEMLRSPIVSGCVEIEELPSMETLVSLELLWVEGFVALMSIWVFTSINVSGFFQLEEFPPWIKTNQEVPPLKTRNYYKFSL